ncbi:sugar transport protein 8-like [Salvia miltiorrhiza]|uniref:sugar transport protein 8-like n=1 Tax=Salvia miltiorrhiza TaxID=226208 RepID=UPI0025AD1AA0|nr:sugar transport protein 8-like [Salvia miltiorrhiza]
MTVVDGSSSSSAGNFKSKTTAYVVVCWIFAAMGGLMFGYDIGISGGVSAMDDFLVKFFPNVYARKLTVHEDNYCKYDDQMLQLFTSSLYLAALVASFGASKACTILGRRPTIRLASVFFIVAALISALAPNKILLILGRILFGIGVGFGNESVPLFLSEVAPPHHRGAVNILFQLFVTIGILIANLVNFAVANVHPFGWRIALGVAGVPGLFLCIGSFVIMETPSSLIERGYETEGRQALQKVRGMDDVERELEYIKHACEQAKKVKQPFKKLMQRESVPPLTIAIWIQIFQQFTGINAIMFYAPVLFQTMGFRNDGALLSAVITGIVNVLSTFVSIVAVDKLGRRKLLLQACVQMLICLVGSGVILQLHLKSVGTLDSKLATIVVVLVCLFVMSFAWSWGPMGWLIPSEVFPLETRTAGFAFAVSTNMLLTFIIAQAFLSMLCHMRAGIFFFFAAWVVVMGVFVFFLLPETKGIAIDEMADRVWKVHPVWKRFMPKEGKGAEMT